LSVKRRAILVEFDFDGAAPPAPGANTGKYGFCHTTGGIYTQGQVVYDDGVAITILTLYKMQELITTTAIVGAVSLIVNGFYVAQTGVAPYSWTLKGDGSGTGVGAPKFIRIPFTFASGNVDSTTTIPAGSRILRSMVNMVGGAAFDDVAATVEVLQDPLGAPVTLQATTESDLDSVSLDTYQTQPLVTVGVTAVVRAAVVPAAASVGSGEVIVEYVETFLG